jgi:hypothetical protein
VYAVTSLGYRDADPRLLADYRDLTVEVTGAAGNP